MYEHIEVERIDRIALIRFNRPEVMNCVNARMSQEIGDAMEAFAADPELWVAIVTGAGDRAFCAGADLKALAPAPPLPIEGTQRRGFAGFVRQFCTKPVIAAVNGLALGGGTEIALACDLIIAADDAEFALPEVKHGLLASGGGLVRLPRQVPLKVAMYYITTGERMPASVALQWGLVNQLVPRAQVLSAALELARRICKNAPLAVRTSKEVVYRALDTSLNFPQQAWEISAEFAKRNRESEDYKEGPAAFREKRTPVWKGR